MDYRSSEYGASYFSPSTLRIYMSQCVECLHIYTFISLYYNRHQHEAMKTASYRLSFFDAFVLCFYFLCRLYKGGVGVWYIFRVLCILP